MDCKKIDLLKEPEDEFKIKITLPTPNSFNNSEAMTEEEKDAFWKSAFAIKESRSEKIQVNSARASFSEYSAMEGQAYSAGALHMRGDEHHDFSQFAAPFESEEQKSNMVIPMNSLIQPGGTFIQYGSQLQVPPIPTFPQKPSTIRSTGLLHSTLSPFHPISQYLVPADNFQGMTDSNQMNEADIMYNAWKGREDLSNK